MTFVQAALLATQYSYTSRLLMPGDQFSNEPVTDTSALFFPPVAAPVVRLPYPDLLKMDAQAFLTSLEKATALLSDSNH